MRRLLSMVILVSALLGLCAQPASACLWDRELVAHERQFKASYLETPAESQSPGQVIGFRGILALLVSLTGVGMLVSGVGIAIVRGWGARRSGVSDPAPLPADWRPIDGHGDTP